MGNYLNLTVLKLVIIMAASANSSWAKSLKNELMIHIIAPKFRINWDSPKSLGSSKGLNSMKEDYPPIGHFAVELNCEIPNKYGAKTHSYRHGRDEKKRVK